MLIFFGEGQLVRAKFDGPCHRKGCSKNERIKSGDYIIHLGCRKNFHVGCEPGGPLDRHPLVQIAQTECGPLPQAPTEGEGGFVAPTLQDWEAVAAAYRQSGYSAEIVNPARDTRFGGGFQYFLVLDSRVRISTTVNAHGGDAREKGRNAIDIVLMDMTRPGRLVVSTKKILRTPGWQGRVMNRANKLLSTANTSGSKLCLASHQTHAKTRKEGA